jgi:hypothetical protein
MPEFVPRPAEIPVSSCQGLKRIYLLGASPASRRAANRGRTTLAQLGERPLAYLLLHCQQIHSRSAGPSSRNDQTQKPPGAFAGINGREKNELQSFGSADAVSLRTSSNNDYTLTFCGTRSKPMISLNNFAVTGFFQ